MSDTKKKIAVIVAILAVCMSFCGCSESILNSSGSNDTSGTTSEIWTAKDDDIIAWAEGENLSEEDKEYYNVTFNYPLSKTGELDITVKKLIGVYTLE